MFTLNIGDYEPEITALALEQYADKIGADFCVIIERKFSLLLARSSGRLARRSPQTSHRG